MSTEEKATAAKAAEVAGKEETVDWKVYKEVMAACDAYMGLKDCSNKRVEGYPYPQKIYVLSELIKVHILRETGDIKQFLKLDDMLSSLPGRQMSKYDITIRKMIDWLDKSMQAIPDTSDGALARERAVLSMLVWGEHYTNKMLNWTFRSLLAGGNLPALVKEKDTTIYFQTDERTRAQIEASSITEKIKALGVHFEYAIVPDDLIGALQTDQTTYFMVGAGASLGIHYCKKTGAAFHHAYPDVIYSEKYFAELLRISKDHNIILAPGMRSDESMFFPASQPYHKGDAISIPADELMALHMNCMHMSAWPYLVNNRPKFWTYPQSHVILWEAEDSVHFNCPHLNAIWLSHSAMRGLADRYYMSLDSELDLVCHDENFYIPQLCDSLYLLEFSEQARSPIPDTFAEAQDVGRYMWKCITHRDVFKFFIRGMQVPINRKVRPQPVNFMPNMQMAAEKNYLFNAMMATDPYMGMPLARKRNHEGRIFAFVA